MQRSHRYQSGVALVAVLWVVVLLAALASALLATSRSDARRLRGDLVRLQAGEAAEAGIVMAVVALSGPNGGGWPIDGASKSLKFDNAEIEISVWAEAGKIDLNTADRALIRGLLVVEGIGPGAADVLADTIMDRRGPANLHHLNSGEGTEEAQHVAFESLGELMQLPGMTRDLYGRLVPNLTLYSGAPNVDTGVAPRDVLLAMPGKTAADAELLLKARTSPALRGVVSAAANDLSRMGQAFTISAVARLPGGVIARRKKIIRLTGNPSDPAWVLAVE